MTEWWIKLLCLLIWNSLQLVTLTDYSLNRFRKKKSFFFVLILFLLSRFLIFVLSFSFFFLFFSRNLFSGSFFPSFLSLFSASSFFRFIFFLPFLLFIFFSAFFSYRFNFFKKDCERERIGLVFDHKQQLESIPDPLARLGMGSFILKIKRLFLFFLSFLNSSK